MLPPLAESDFLLFFCINMLIRTYSGGTQFINLVILRNITQNYVTFCKNQNGRFFIIFEGNYVKFRDFHLLKKLKNKKISLKKKIKNYIIWSKFLNKLRTVTIEGLAHAQIEFNF